MNDKKETNECLKSTDETYRDNYDAIFRKNHAVEVDPATGELAEKKPAGEDNAVKDTVMLTLCAAAL